MNANISSFAPHAVVVGGGLNALGVVRSLAAAQVPLTVLDDHADSPAMRSRHGRKRQLAALEGSVLVEALEQLARESGAPVMLFVTEEKGVNTISAERQRLAASCLLRLPEHARLMQLMHKQGFAELAEQHAAPVPKTAQIGSVADLDKLATLRFPCVFKPAYKHYGYGARFKKAYRVSSADQVRALYAEIAPVMPDMVAQEWIEGDDEEIYFCLQYLGRKGELVAAFSGRKIRSWPLHIGGTASCTAAWEHHELLSAMTHDFFLRTGFVGMGSMEYKRDRRDGRFYMVEPTVGRTDYQEEVATLNGINIPLAAYRHEAGLPPLPLPPRATPPRIWRDPQADKWSLQENQGKPDARSVGDKVVDAYLRWDDPRPWLDLFWQRISALLRSRLGGAS